MSTTTTPTVKIEIFIERTPKGHSLTANTITLVKDADFEEYTAFAASGKIGVFGKEAAGFVAHTRIHGFGTNADIKLGTYATLEEAALALLANYLEVSQSDIKINLTPNPFFAQSYKMASLTMPYEQLVQILGEPNVKGSSDGKTTKEWNLLDDIGRKVCAWDWKTTGAFKDNTQWSVFGDRYLLGQLFGDKLQYLP